MKNQFKETYHSEHALRSPPHITLYMPFNFCNDREDLLISSLVAFSSQIHPFEIILTGFGAFEPRVIYVDVAPNESLAHVHDSLQKHMRHELKINKDTYKNRGFHPHMTVAFRDLSKANFRSAWEEYKNKTFAGAFDSKDIALLKHNGRIWEVFRRFDYSYEN